MADIKETVPFNFDELYSGLKTKFEAKGYDTEEGSNTSQLITAMAYLTSMLNVNTAVNINETILPLATKRDNALADARALGYEIQHKRSYQYLIKLQLSAGDTIVPKYSKFSYGDKNYYYLGKQLEITITQEQADAGYFIELTLIEGSLFKYADYPEELIVVTGTETDASGNEYDQYYIDIPFVDVEDDSGIEVYVTYYDDFGNLVTQEEWSKSDQFMIDADTVLNKQFIRLDNVDFKTPRIYFKLAGIGEGVRNGSIVEMNVLTTSGDGGAIADTSDLEGISHSLTNVEITNLVLLSSGQDEEALEQIQANAPLFHNTANRAVTKLDYEAICNRQNSVTTSLVWGGDDEYPRSPGHIWFSFLPKRNENVRVFESDSFNTEYNLSGDWDFDWDYTLDAVNDEEEYAAQQQLADNTYDDWYLQNGEIRSFELNDDGNLIKPGIWDVLDNYKIPTLEFHNRHPIYLDFEYDISILKYNISDSKAQIHENIFNTIDNFFTGTSETVTMEKFENEYFHSSLEKRIDKILTDKTGYNNDVTTKLVLNEKNISIENLNTSFRDLYIPLAIPFENYFDENGYLEYNVLPSIDTENFVEYGEGETGQGIYTDWSEIQGLIDNSTTQVAEDLIVAPIRVNMKEEVTLTDSQQYVSLSRTSILPDDPTTLDAAPAFNKTIVTLNSLVINWDENPGWTLNGASQIVLAGLAIENGDELRVQTTTPYGVEYDETVTLSASQTTINLATAEIYDDNTPTYEKTKIYINDVEINKNANPGWIIVDPLDPDQIFLQGLTIEAGDVLRVDSNPQCGVYQLFNSYKKFIIIQLYVDASDAPVVQGFETLYDTPKSYLTTVDAFYGFTDNEFYLTTEGYYLTDDDQPTSLSGPIARLITGALYSKSPLRFELFKKNRYLDFNYNSPNFLTTKNVLPRLKRVTFEQGV